MAVFKELRFKNVHTFVDGKVRLDGSSLTSVCGRNMDSLHAEHQNNGAGKTLLFLMLPIALIYGDHKLLVKESVIEVDLEAYGKQYTIKLENKHYTITENGVDLEIRKDRKAALERIRALIGLDELDWFSFVHSTTSKTYAWQHGTDVSRMSYVTSVWRLDNYDAMRKYFEKKLDECKRAEAQYEVYATNISDINQQLNTLNYTPQKLNEYVVEAMAKKIRQLQDKVQDGKIRENQHAAYNRCKQAYVECRKEVVMSGKAAEATLNQWREFDLYTRELTAYNNRLNRLTAELTELKRIPAVAYTDAMAEMDSLLNTLNTLQPKAKSYDELLEAKDDLDDHKDPALKPFLQECKELGTDPLERCRDGLDRLKPIANLGKLVKTKTTVCPTCQSAIDLNALQTRIKKANTKMAEIQSIMNAYQVFKERRRIDAALKDLAFDEDHYDTCTMRYNALRKQCDGMYEDMERYQVALERRKVIVAEMKSLVKPQEVKQPKHSVQAAQTTLMALKQSLEIEREIKFYEDAKEPFDYKPFEAELEQLSDKFSVLNRKVSDIKSAKAQYDLLIKQRDTLVEKSRQSKALKGKAATYRDLAKAYGGVLKAHAANAILMRVEQLYNQYAHKAFAESAKFRLRASQKGISVEVTMSGKPRDVRELSGAESDSFRLLHFVASLLMTPPARRPNLVVLDEPDSHMDDVTRNLMLHDYLPFLETIVPNVFLMTQRAYEVPNKLIVTKKDGVSRVC